MGLTKDEWGRRLKAAIELRGLDLQDLPAKLEALRDDYSVASHGPARAARAGDAQEPTRGMGRAVAAALDLPEDWFLVDDFDEWLSREKSSAAEAEQADEIRAIRLELRASLSAVRTEQERQRRLLERLLDDEAGEGNG